MRNWPYTVDGLGRFYFSRPLALLDDEKETNMNKNLDDISDDRIGQWMHTSLGGRFYPEDPRITEIFISDIANGLALDCRYAGQGNINKFYSVAEHSVICARFAIDAGYEAMLCMAILLHDAAEAYINDVNRATKAALNCTPLSEPAQPGAYSRLEDSIQVVINRKYNVDHLATTFRDVIKDIDRRIVPLEKEALFGGDTQRWAFDQFLPLHGVEVKCLPPRAAKLAFLTMYEGLCFKANVKAEEWML